jgi:AcrR family transcriptional regulator
MEMKNATLQPEDWAAAALEVIADAGVGAVAVEGLARRVGASKGSFYWHYESRAAVIAAAVRLWEQRRTTDVIDAVAGVEDPRERLRGVFATAYANPSAGRVEAALGVHGDEPEIGSALRRVTCRRLAFVEETFAELGLDAEEARRRALVAYSSYLGFFAVRDALRGDLPEATAPTYIDDVLELLVST